MYYLGYMMAAGQSLYRVYSSLEAMAWQPNIFLKEATRLSEESHALARQNGLRDDIQIVWANLYGAPAMAIGNNSYTSSAVYILVDQHYVTTETNPYVNDAMNVVMRHEYSHLLHDDFLKSKFVPAIASLVSTVVGVMFLSPLTTFTLTTLTGLATHALYSRYAEERADNEAFKQSSLMELESFRELLELSKLNNIQLRKQNLMGQFCFSAEGDDRRQIFSYPSLNGRIKALSDAIKAKTNT